MFVNLSEEQARMGYEVHVIARRSRGQLPRETVNGVEVHRVSSPYNFTALELSMRLTRGEKDWVLHPHATSGIFLKLTHRWIPTPLVCHSHGTSRSHEAPASMGGETLITHSGHGIAFHVLRERMLWSSADRLLVVSRAVKDDVTRFYGLDPGRVRVVYNGVDTELFSPGKGGPLPAQVEGLAGKRLILFVGHFGFRKGIIFAIRAMRQVRAEFPDAHLLCIGGTPAWMGKNDYKQMLRAEAQRNGVEDCVTLLDAVRNEELVEFYRRSEVFVLPSYYEAFSKVAAEAMACGRPVVATRTGALPELVSDGESGFLVSFGSTAAISERLIRLLGDGALRAAMGKRGRETIVSQFTWRKVAERTRDVYNEL